MKKSQIMDNTSTPISLHDFSHANFPILWFQAYLDKDELNHRDFILWLTLWNFAGGDTKNWYRLEKEDFFEMIGFEKNHKKSFVVQAIHHLKAKKCIVGTFSQKKTHLNQFIYFKLLKSPFTIVNDEKFTTLLEKVRDESALIYENGLREFNAQKEEQRIVELQKREERIRKKKEANRPPSPDDYFDFKKGGKF